MMSTGIFYDPLFLKHETFLHPENPDRLAWILAEFRRTGLWERCLHPECRDATVEELCAWCTIRRTCGACAEWRSRGAECWTRRRWWAR